MALHLDLFHEVHKQRALQRRDPLKFAIVGLVLVAVGMAAYYGFQLTSRASLGNEAQRLRGELAALAPKSEAAKKRADELNVVMKQGELLVKRMEDRFYWAPLLESLAGVVPRDVQISRLSGEVSGDAIKRVSLTLDGKAAGQQPLSVADEFRKNLSQELQARYKQSTVAFRGSLDELPDRITLDGKQLSAVSFGIIVTLTIGEEPAAEAAHRQAKK